MVGGALGEMAVSGEAEAVLKAPIAADLRHSTAFPCFGFPDTASDTCAAKKKGHCLPKSAG